MRTQWRVFILTKYALVTASTKGIGKSIGTMLLQRGYYVFFNYSKDTSAADELENEVKQFHGRYSVLKADVSSVEGINGLVSELKALTNTLDCIVLNAGATCKVPFEDITLSEWEHVMATNVNMPFYLLQQVDSCLSVNARVIFISSHLGIHPHATSIPYSVSKAASIMLAKSMVKVYKGRSITVNAIAPGFVDTDWHQTKEASHRERIQAKIALGRFAFPEEVALLCSQIIDNGYLNGAVLPIDGGYDME